MLYNYCVRVVISNNFFYPATISAARYLPGNIHITKEANILCSQLWLVKHELSRK